MSNIYILTGPIRSGKTTALKKWISSGSDIAGILSPDFGDERRFQHFPDQRHFRMLAVENEQEIYKIGKFSFSRNAFYRASTLLREDAESGKYKWIIIDEIGPLELKKQGFYALLKELLNGLDACDFKLLIVVREALVEEISSFFNIMNYQIIDKNELPINDQFPSNKSS